MLDFPAFSALPGLAEIRLLELVPREGPSDSFDSVMWRHAIECLNVDILAFEGRNNLSSLPRNLLLGPFSHTFG